MIVKIATVKPDVGFFSGPIEGGSWMVIPDGFVSSPSAKEAADSFFRANPDAQRCYVGRARIVTFEVRGQSVLAQMQSDLFASIGDNFETSVWPKKVTAEEIGNIVNSAMKSFLHLKGEQTEWTIVEGAELVSRDL
jgi:hypothetical protein